MTTAGRILVVCTGNVCRSPYAELALRDRLQGGAVSVESAGTGALVGEPMHPVTLELLARRGIDGSGFLARDLVRDQVLQAELVLTAERSHRAQVLDLAPAALRRTFTLRQLARLVASSTDRTPVASLTDLVERAGRARARGGAGGSDLDDIEDPWGRPRELFEAMAQQLDEVVELLSSALSDSSRR